MGSVEASKVMGESAKRPHLAFVDGVRALAALYVVAHHVYLHLHPFGDSFWGWVLAPLRHGHYAVDLFIVVSGFCLMLPVVLNGGQLRGGVKGFVARRMWRILPPYYMALVISLALVWWGGLGGFSDTHWDTSLQVVRRDVVLHGLLLHDFQRPYKINHCFWSIAVEFHIYLLFPLILVLWRKAGAWICSLTLTALVIAMSVWQQARGGELSWLPVAWHYVALFGFGMLAAHLAYGPVSEAVRARAGKWAAWIWWGLAIPLGVVVLQLPIETYVPLDLVAGVASGALLVHQALNPGSMLRRVCERRGLVVVGLFSFSLYLLHAPLIQVGWLYLVAPLGLSTGRSMAMLFGLIPAIVAACYVFYLLFERPFIGRIPTVQQVLEVLSRWKGRTAPERLPQQG